MIHDEGEWLGLTDVAHSLGITRNQLTYLVAARRCPPPAKLDRRLCWPRSVVNDWVAARQREQVNTPEPIDREEAIDIIELVDPVAYGKDFAHRIGLRQVGLAVRLVKRFGLENDYGELIQFYDDWVAQRDRDNEEAAWRRLAC